MYSLRLKENFILQIVMIKLKKEVMIQQKKFIMLGALRALCQIWTGL